MKLEEPKDLWELVDEVLEAQVTKRELPHLATDFLEKWKSDRQPYWIASRATEDEVIRATADLLNYVIENTEAITDLIPYVRDPQEVPWNSKMVIAYNPEKQPEKVDVFKGSKLAFSSLDDPSKPVGIISNGGYKVTLSFDGLFVEDVSYIHRRPTIHETTSSPIHEVPKVYEMLLSSFLNDLNNRFRAEE